MIAVVLLAMFWAPTVIGLVFGSRPHRHGRRSAGLPEFRRSARPASLAPPAAAEPERAASEVVERVDHQRATLPAESLQWSALDDRQLMRYLAGSAQ